LQPTSTIWTPPRSGARFANWLERHPQTIVGSSRVSFREDAPQLKTEERICYRRFDDQHRSQGKEFDTEYVTNLPRINAGLGLGKDPICWLFRLSQFR
jgi:hypothetical protein